MMKFDNDGIKKINDFKKGNNIEWMENFIGVKGGDISYAKKCILFYR
jgi:hypothetical protein